MSTMRSTDRAKVIAFGKALSRWLKTNKAYACLPDNCTWSAGGCWILARALKKYIGKEAKLETILSAGLQIPQHVVVRVGDVYLDGDGASSAWRLVQRWEKLEWMDVTDIVPFSKDLQRVGRSQGIPCAAGTVDRLVDEITKKFGRWE